MLKHTQGRIVVKVPLLHKNEHMMENGQVLSIERQYNNLNRRETEPVNGWVISAENIPEGAEVLIGHNATHDTFKITNHNQLSGGIIAGKIEYFAIPEDQAFLWRVGHGKWQPIKGYATGLRVFKPYEGVLTGIEPKQMKNVLYVTSGGLTGKICQTVRAADYELVFNDFDRREHRIIRFRHYDDGIELNGREDELTCIRNDLTKELKAGKLLIGLTAFDAKPLKELAHA
jgi:hypothetical protein